MAAPPARANTSAEVIRLRAQIEDLNATLTAIRHGDVDAIVIGDSLREQLYSLSSADRPYRTIVEDMGEGAATISRRGVVVFANRQLCDLVQRSPSDLLGSDVADLVVEADQQALSQILQREPGETARSELTMSRADTTGVPVLASATGLDIDGVIVRCLVVTDLSEQKQTERDLAEAVTELASRASELERTIAELARSNEELTQFAYITSHDLSEPLRTVSGFADLLMSRYQGQLEPEAVEFIEYIVAGTQRMQLLINDLLAYGRVDTRAQAMKPIDTDHLVRATLADLAARIEEVHAEIRVDDLPPVIGDPSQLRQVFLNLLRNALMFARDGVPPEIHVSGVQEGDGWRFTVADNGIGISPDHRQQVFGMFRRLHTREEYPGTGIGLAIVEKVVYRHGGRVWIEENEGGGTKMVFTLAETPKPGDLEPIEGIETAQEGPGESHDPPT